MLLKLAEAGGLSLLSSEALEFEIGRIPNPGRRQHALLMLSLASERVVVSPEAEGLARTLHGAGLQPMDALHRALAVVHRADFFCSTDDRLLKEAKGLETHTTKLVTPIELVMEVETCT